MFVSWFPRTDDVREKFYEQPYSGTTFLGISEMKESVHSTLGMGRTWGPMPKYGRCGAAADVESGRRPSTITGRTQSRKATWTLCTCQPAVPACFNRPRCFGISLSKPIFEGSGRNLCTRKRKPLKATCESSHDRTNYRLRSRGVEEEMAKCSFGGCSISKRAPLIRGKWPAQAASRHRCRCLPCPWQSDGKVSGPHFWIGFRGIVFRPWQRLRRMPKPPFWIEFRGHILWIEWQVQC